MRLRSAAIVLLLVCCNFVFGADPLSAVFVRIDAAAKSFHGMTATVANTTHDSLTDDNDVQNGTMKLLRVNETTTRALVELKGGFTGDKSVALNGNEILLYNPKTKILEQHDITKYKDTVNQYLLLGFGASSEALKSAYEISYVGEEKIGAQTASHLKLTPKSKETLKSLKQADLWFADNGLVVQQKFLYPSGNYKLATYSNVKLGAVTEKELALNPKGATLQREK